MNSELSGLVGCSKFEAETATKSGSGDAVDGATAWRMFTNGYVQASYNFTSTAKHTIRVYATGEGLSVRQPNLQLSVNGTVIGNRAVSDPDYQYGKYDFTYTPPSAGVRTVRIGFTNDAVIGGVDVNLVVEGWYVCPCHDMCQEGGFMTPGCGQDSGQRTCLSQICSSDSFCCVWQWDTQCVQDVFNVCARDCQ